MLNSPPSPTRCHRTLIIVPGFEVSSAGIATTSKATNRIMNKGQMAFFISFPIRSAAPPTISTIITIHAKTTGIGNPIPVSIPVIPEGFISLASPGIRNRRPNVTLRIAIPCSLLSILFAART